MKTIIVIAAFLITAISSAEVYDLRYGTVEAPEGYKLIHDGTIDSFRGRLVRTANNFTISFDIGGMAGIAVPKMGTMISPLFFRRHSINGVPSTTEMRKKAEETVIVSTIGYEVSKSVEPANFEALISSQEDVAEYFAIIGTYNAKK
jgi:hypothetical protein